MVLGRPVQASRQVQLSPSCQLAVSTVGADSRPPAAPGGFPYWAVFARGWDGAAAQPIAEPVLSACSRPGVHRGPAEGAEALHQPGGSAPSVLRGRGPQAVPVL